MTKVLIKYNPYKVETEIKINDAVLKENSILKQKSQPGMRLQEWIDELPSLLVQETNDRDFSIAFHGTMMDYEDLKYVLEEAFRKREITHVECDRIPAKETKDKEAEIERIFQMVQKGSFPELRSDEIIRKFQQAKNKKLEICVVATMSAGKSTLINALLGDKLMPSEQQACTAIITKITDNDNPVWEAEAYERTQDGDFRLMKKYPALTYEQMKELNANKAVKKVEITGNIPFSSSEEMSLVIVDTPGPNNARDTQHRSMQEEYLNKDSKDLVLYIMEPAFGSDSDAELLRKIAESMASRGKQARDRFIFVLNKMDDRKEEDGDISRTLDHAREYLKKYGIENPNLFPVSALAAMDIRLFQKNLKIPEMLTAEFVTETGRMVEKLTQPGYAFETYAPLPERLRNAVRNKLEQAEEAAKSADVESAERESEKLYKTKQSRASYEDAVQYGEIALLHSGIPAVEAAIEQYLVKYAGTAKIYDLVNAFMEQLESLHYVETLKTEVMRNQTVKQNILRQIQETEKKKSSMMSARQFENKISAAISDVQNQSRTAVMQISKAYQAKISSEMLRYRGKKLSVGEASDLLNKMTAFAKELQQNYVSELNRIIQNTLYQTCKSLVNEYKQKLSSITSEISSSLNGGISFRPLAMMNSRIPQIRAEDFTHEERVKNKPKWMPNVHKRWYKPWTWLEERGHWEVTFRKMQYVPSDELCQQFFTPVQKLLIENSQSAAKYIKEESESVSQKFMSEFEQLDRELDKKTELLKDYAVNREQAEQRLVNSQRRLEWIKQIETMINHVLEI